MTRDEDVEIITLTPADIDVAPIDSDVEIIDPDRKAPYVDQMSTRPTPPAGIEREPIELEKLPPTTGDQAELLGMGQGAFGLGDEISAGMRAVKDTALTPERKWSDLLRLYRAYKGNAKRDVARAEAEHPGRSLAGALPVAMIAGGKLASAVPETFAATHPTATRIGTNIGLSALNNYGRDTLTPGNVATDVLAGEGMNLAAKGAQLLGRRGVKGLVGDAMQLPQRGVNKASDAIGSLSPEARQLSGLKRTMEQEAASHLAAEKATLSGADFESRLATAVAEGRASVGPGRSYQVSPAEFGDDITRMSRDATREAVEANPIASKAVLNLDEDVIKQIRRSPEVVSAGQRAGTVRRGSGAGPGDDIAKQVNDDAMRRIAEKETASVSKAQELLDKYRAAKAARTGVESGIAELDPKLAAVKRVAGRGVVEKLAGKALGGASGGLLGGPIGAVGGMALGGKTVGGVALGAVDALGDAGARLAKTDGLAKIWAMRDDDLGRAARWALSAEGPALLARLATLAKLPEASAELNAE